MPVAPPKVSRIRLAPEHRFGRLVGSLLVAIVVASGLAAPAVLAGNLDSGTLPRRDLLERALAAYRRVDQAGLLRTRLLTVIDYSIPSSQRRLWVVEPASRKVLFHEFVAHGSGSATEENPELAVQFGNEESSRRSSLGTFLTGDTYTGKHGHSLRLLGLDPGVNDKALERQIVIHPADYVSAEFRATQGGRVGRSLGCPALDPAVAPAIIDCIRDGSVLYVAGAAVAPAEPLASAARSASRGR